MATRSLKIVNVSIAVGNADGILVRRTVVIDEYGQVWEFNDHKQEWKKLPALPEVFHNA